MKHLLSSSAYIVVNKMLSKRVGLKASVLLADLISKEMYFENRGEIKDGFFFNTSKNIERDTTLTYCKQKAAIQILKDEGFIETKLMGVPATLHFKILQNKIDGFLKSSIKKTSKLELKKLKTNKNKTIRITNKNKDISYKKSDILISPLSSAKEQGISNYNTPEGKKEYDEAEINFKKSFLFTRKSLFELNVRNDAELKNIPENLYNDFIDYWTEPNPSETKMRFELEKTFCIKRRLSRWIKNDKKWNKKESKIESQIDVWQKVNDKLRNG
tara:strand:+ start:3595 stop:4410 length:816 start_codon:yes stop_codon:yes gene_type:complete